MKYFLEEAAGDVSKEPRETGRSGGGVEGQAGRGGVGLRRGADGGGRKEGREGNVD